MESSLNEKAVDGIKVQKDATISVADGVAVDNIALTVNDGVTLTLDSTGDSLVLDAISGNNALFVRADEVRAAWAWTDSVINAWQQAGLAMGSYPAGQWGPQRAARFLPPGLIEKAQP